MFELNSFISKFTQLYYNGLTASLQLKSCRGNLMVNLEADLGCPEPQPFFANSFPTPHPKLNRRRRRHRNQTLNRKTPATEETSRECGC